MEEETQLHHLPRYEKKRLVKGWHATQVPSDLPPSVPRTLFATPPGALEYESSRTETWRSNSDLSSVTLPKSTQQLEDKLPKTVGQVKLAYRTRAREQEARDASNAIRQREKFLEVRRGPKWREQLSKPKKLHQHSEPPLECPQETADDKEGAATSPQDDESELQLVNLPVDQVVTCAEYRDEILRQIRHRLVNGSDVLLQSDCASSKETVGSTRLMLQTLCTQSLVYCVRDQNLVPESHLQPQSTTRLTLRLLPRSKAIT
ncbi:hypothetical protein PR003_g14226 [Phytophthora rubi]|uniref:Uncharacterized protein n=1 Tax=Phytophthora rubi TaxID=129364 RepID=A0A6A4EVC4_9STRA|nr:hypothetical protein PR001_g13549 [Phytophthora rubi]KAE9023338.1 hypothetical protein PR002_g11738 [Phytophthora rubi]KAE9333028.1 hypothetical protein PR003_g14226 [Phytophthora rubi]